MTLKVLFTNNTLKFHSGSELYVRDVALALTARGHRCFAYSTIVGEVGRELEKAGIWVGEDLERLPEKPDVIHGHHHLESLTALLKFADVPAVHFCHGPTLWEEAPPVFPRIRRYVAIDIPCRRRIEAAGIDPRLVEVVPNFVDLARFRPRETLPVQPRRALLFSNTVSQTDLAKIRKACNSCGLELDLLGTVGGAFCSRPEERLGNHDLIFAKGRAALESLAVGAAVIICSEHGMGPMVRLDNLDRLRGVNLGAKAATGPISADGLLEQIKRYDRADAAGVSQRIRREAGREPAVERLLTIYRAAIAEQDRRDRAPNDELAAAGDYLEGLNRKIKACDGRFGENQCVFLAGPEGLLEQARNRRSARLADGIARWVRKLRGNRL